MNKLLLAFVFPTLLAALPGYGQSSGVSSAAEGYNVTEAAMPQGKTLVFLFLPEDDMFYIPFQGNGDRLDELVATVDHYKKLITDGIVKINVAGYSSALATRAENLASARIRANRVKSELILRNGIKGENFATTVHAAPFEGRKSVVVVTLRVPQIGQVRPEARPEPRPEPKPEPVAEQPKKEPQPEAKVQPQLEPEPVIAEQSARYSRWSVGANIGLPFFWGDMTSLAADKTYIGVMAGVQATYQASPLLGITLSFDWAQNRAGSRGYAKNYLLDASGMTWYTPQPFTTQAYGDLYSKIDMYSAGLHLDLNVNRLFGPGIANGRLKLIVSPAVYAQHFSSKVYTKSDDKVFAGDRLSKDLSLGLGGDVALRYDLSRTIDLQLKGTGIWITDNLFDNIRTVGYVKQNAMWGVSAGVVWKLGGRETTNLLHKKK